MRRSDSLGDQRKQPSRLRDFLAIFQWILESWRRPADAEARWQQR